MAQRINSKCVFLEGQDEPIPFSGEESILELFLNKKIDLAHSCGGMGTCGTCRVIVLEGELPDRNPIELERANDLGFRPNERLACQLPPSPNLKLQLPKKR